MSRRFIVIWEIGVDADSPLEAARIAQQIQRDPDSFATEFIVNEINGAPDAEWVIDLLDPATHPETVP